MANRKTIRMPAADLKKVLKALRDPANQNKQGEGSMFDGEGYCCLGVMQCVKTGGKVEVAKGSGKASHIVFLGFPSLAWLEKVGWTFKTMSGKKASNPWLPSLGMYASEANDVAHISFIEIADAIKKAASTY